jgi:hypothetical protein
VPAKDLYHDVVKRSLVKDGWTITHDPLVVPFGRTNLYVDLCAVQRHAAEKGARRIAVEIKSFRSPSDLHDLEEALGQYVFYRALMKGHEPDRKLFLAVSENVFQAALRRPIAEVPLEELGVALLTFDPAREEIVRWIR